MRERWRWGNYPAAGVVLDRCALQPEALLHKPFAVCHSVDCEARRRGSAGNRLQMKTESQRAYRQRLYFIQGRKTKMIKIGVSVDPSARLKELQANSPDELVLLAVVGGMEEAIVHERFRQDRAHGEWFHPSQGLIEFIESVSN